MDWSLIITGVAIGLALSAPLGPVNLIVIRTALRHDLKVAFLAGLGAVLADVLIAGIAAYGIQSIAHLILNYSKYLQIASGVFLSCWAFARHEPILPRAISPAVSIPPSSA